MPEKNPTSDTDEALGFRDGLSVWDRERYRYRRGELDGMEVASVGRRLIARLTRSLDPRILAILIPAILRDLREAQAVGGPDIGDESVCLEEEERRFRWMCDRRMGSAEIATILGWDLESVVHRRKRLTR